MYHCIFNRHFHLMSLKKKKNLRILKFIIFLGTTTQSFKIQILFFFTDVVITNIYCLILLPAKNIQNIFLKKRKSTFVSFLFDFSFTSSIHWRNKETKAQKHIYIVYMTKRHMDSWHYYFFQSEEFLTYDNLGWSIKCFLVILNPFFNFLWHW